jgi:hypothetical protein
MATPASPSTLPTQMPLNLQNGFRMETDQSQQKKAAL